MTEFNDNLWAPWRMEYIRSLGDEHDDCGCFLCQYWADPDHDAIHHVIHRGQNCYVVMNRFPYTNGHLMVTPGIHVGDINEISDEVYVEMSQLVRDATQLLKITVQSHGFNIGYNLGLCAGAGVPGHIHAHIVPRWNGDTNYMAVLGKVRVVPDALDALYAELINNVQSVWRHE